MVAIFFANKMEFYELLEFELIFIKIHLEITADLSEQVININDISGFNVSFFALQQYLFELISLKFFLLT